MRKSAESNCRSIGKNYYLKIKDYYSNIKKPGLEYEEPDYSKSFDFLLMTVSGIDEKK